jgi:catechol-2,3-dioxygenase
MTPHIHIRTVNLDCADAHEMARFYGGLLGWTPTAVEPNWVLMRDPGGGTGLSFQKTDWYERPAWPEEPGQQQKMLHLEATRLALSSGGTLAEPQARDDLRVVLDPSGHPLCLFLD